MGYVGNSWSQRSEDARNKGIKPVSCITKEDILEHGVDVGITFFRWFVSKYYPSNEWHHSFNRRVPD